MDLKDRNGPGPALGTVSAGPVDLQDRDGPGGGLGRVARGPRQLGRQLGPASQLAQRDLDHLEGMEDMWEINFQE